MAPIIIDSVDLAETIANAMNALIEKVAEKVVDKVVEKKLAAKATEEAERSFVKKGSVSLDIHAQILDESPSPNAQVLWPLDKEQWYDMHRFEDDYEEELGDLIRKDVIPPMFVVVAGISHFKAHVLVAHPHKVNHMVKHVFLSSEPAKYPDDWHEHMQSAEEALRQLLSETTGRLYDNAEYIKQGVFIG